MATASGWLLPKKTKGGFCPHASCAGAGRPQRRSGAASFVAPMLPRGTKKHPFSRSDELDRLKAEVHLGRDRSSADLPNVTTFDVLTVRDPSHGRDRVADQVLREPPSPAGSRPCEGRSPSSRSSSRPMANGSPPAGTHLSLGQGRSRHVPSAGDDCGAQAGQGWRTWPGCTARSVSELGPDPRSATWTPPRQAPKTRPRQLKSPKPFERTGPTRGRSQEDVIATLTNRWRSWGRGAPIEIWMDDADYRRFVVRSHPAGARARGCPIARARRKACPMVPFAPAGSPDRSGAIFTAAICAPRTRTRP
jgi:hypothetical protein